jgi:hypothetical protein
LQNLIQNPYNIVNFKGQFEIGNFNVPACRLLQLIPNLENYLIAGPLIPIVVKAG